MMTSTKAVLGLIACLLSTPCFAADVAAADASDDGSEAAVEYPNIKIEGTAELQFDNVRPSGDASARVANAFAKIEPEISVNLSEDFRLFAHLVYEPVVDPAAGGIRYLRDEGLYAEELEGIATFGPVNIGVGKIDPVFGLASDDAPGVYGFDFADSYQYLGALGGRVDWQVGSRAATGFDAKPATVKQTLHAALFDADTTFLSRSLFVDRGQLRRNDGGVGNSDRPESFSVGYDVRTVNEGDDLVGPAAHFALRRLASGSDGGSDEWGFLVNGEDVFSLGDEVSLKSIAELAYFKNEGGGRFDGEAATVGAELREGKWTQSLVGAAHALRNSGNGTDLLLTTSFGRDFDFDRTGAFRIDAAYARSRVDGEDANTFGLRLHKDFTWPSEAE